jgi:hypothetical protein
MALGKVTIHVTPVNEPPVASPDYVLLDEDTAIDIDVLSNDTDPDGDPVSLVGYSQPSHGSVAPGPGKMLHYQPSAHYRGPDAFTYTIADPQGETNQTTVSLIVKPVNHLPAAQSFNFTLNKNSSQNITFAASDPDPEDTQFTFTIVDSPQHGSLWTYPKVATYYPTNGFYGTDSFTYVANDGKGDGPFATVLLTVLDANNPPVVADQAVVAKVNHAAIIRLTASDLDNDPLTFQILTQPESGSLSGTGTNYIYQPNPDFLGTDKFTIQAFDGKDHSAPATVTITVTDKNTPPVVQDFAVTVLFNSSTNITLQATDLESDPLTFHVVTRPVNGKLTGKGQVLTYSPNVNFIGADRFTFKANDGEFDSGIATVSITIDTANHAPLATNQDLVVVESVPASFQLAVTDPDGDPLNCPILNGPQHGRVYGTGTTFTYAPAPGYIGTDKFTFKAWDGEVYSRDGTVYITVNPPPPPLGLAFQSVIPLPNGQIRLLLTTSVNQLAKVLVSSDLVHWTPLPTGTTEGGVTSVIDGDAPLYSQRFYKAQIYVPSQ